MRSEIDEVGVESESVEFDRRNFLRMLGAASLPVVAQACVSESESGSEPRVERFRALNPIVELPCDVKRSRKNQPIIDKGEWISVDPAFTNYLSEGDQCRVYRPDGNFALYTVGQIRNEPGTDRIRMGLEARCRTGSTELFEGTLDTTVVAEGLTDAEASAAGEFVERLVDDGVSSSVIAIAPHGGWIERYTDDQAEHFQATLAAKGSSSWLCKGYKPGGGAFNRWHITSTDISPNSFPGLDVVAERGWAYAVSFHGTSHDIILIGGAAPHELRLAVRDAIAAAVEGSGINVDVADAADEYPGDNPNNVVNWLTAGGVGGIQLEQSLRAREFYGIAIATAVAGVIDALI